MCKSKKGCKIEKLAQDKEVTYIADTWIQIRQLMNDEVYRFYANDKLKDLGLDNPALLIELEKRLTRWRENRKDQRTETKPNGNIRRR